jgi:opacity protein-like surface antigen
MKYKNKILTTTALSTVLVITGFTANVYGQSKNFSGPYITIGTTNQTSDVNVKNNATPTAPTNGIYSASAAIDAAFVGFNSTATTILSRVASSLNGSDDKIIGTASIGYNNPVNNNFLIGVQGSYTENGTVRNLSNSYTTSTVVSSGAGTAGNSSFTVSSAAGTQSVKLSDKESWSISLVPAYAVNNDLMLFGKIGYVNFKQTADITYSNDIATNKSFSKNLDGYTLGVGARYNLNKNFFISAGFDASKFDKYTISQNDTASPSYGTSGASTSAQTLSTTVDNDYIYNTTISIGYTF